MTTKPERVTRSRGTVHGRVVEGNEAHLIYLTSGWEGERNGAGQLQKENELLSYREKDKKKYDSR